MIMQADIPDLPNGLKYLYYGGNRLLKEPDIPEGVVKVYND